MEIRIGIAQSGRELSFEVNQSAEQVRKLISDAAAKDSVPFIEFTDVRGATYLVDTNNIAYIELGVESSRKIGFVG